MNLLRCMPVVIAAGILSFGTTVFSAKTSMLASKVDNEAKNIIKRMADIYKNCTSYFDSGTVTTTFYTAKAPYADKISFTTAFRRPWRFRFEYTSESSSAKVKQHVIWVKNKEVLVWKDVKPEVEKETSLGDAIADAVAKSGGAAQTIPVLIGANEVGGRSLADLLQIKRIEDSSQDGVMCYRIQGKRMPASTSFVTLWISKKTFLIHRIDSAHKSSNFRTETTKIYKPRINITIDESKLGFNVPAQNKKVKK